MSLASASKTAKAISSITWAVDSVGRIVGKGSKAFVNAIKQKQKYTVDVMVDGAITSTRERQTKEDIKSMLNSLEYFENVQLTIRSEHDTK